MYFDLFPKVLYRDEQRRAVYDIADITKRVQFFERYRGNALYSTEYILQDGETPQTLAQDFYNDSQLDWVIMSLNKVIDPVHDWHMDTRSMESFLQEKYPISQQFPGGPDTNYLWVLPDGRFFLYNQSGPNDPLTNSDDLTATGLANSAFRVTYRDYEENINEAKRSVLILNPEQLSGAMDQFKRLMKSLVNVQSSLQD